MIDPAAPGARITQHLCLSLISACWLALDYWLIAIK
jgi:hypothetical protein